MIDDWDFLEEELHRTTAELPNPHPLLKRRILAAAQEQLHRRTIRRRVATVSVCVLLWLSVGFGMSTLMPEPDSVNLAYPRFTSLELTDTETPPRSYAASTEWQMVELRTRLREEYTKLLRSAF